MSIERDYRMGGNIAFRCDTPTCHDFIETYTSEFNEALTMLRAERWTAVAITDKRRVKHWEHFCQQCSDEIARIKEDSIDTLMKGKR